MKNINMPRQSHQRSCEPGYMSLSISLLSTSESKIYCPSPCVPSLVGRSGSVCVVKRQKFIYNAQRVDTEDILMPCHPRRDQLRFYRIHREGQCSRARVPCHRLVVRGDREVYRCLIFYDNCGAYITQFLQEHGALSENGESHGATQPVGQLEGVLTHHRLLPQHP
jgi:hypothetical protein